MLLMCLSFLVHAHVYNVLERFASIITADRGKWARNSIDKTFGHSWLNSKAILNQCSATHIFIKNQCMRVTNLCVADVKRNNPTQPSWMLGIVRRSSGLRCTSAVNQYPRTHDIWFNWMRIRKNADSEGFIARRWTFCSTYKKLPSFQHYMLRLLCEI